MPRKKRKYPDLRKKFKIGDKVCMTYHFPSESKKHYCGRVEVVEKDALDVRWAPTGRLIRSWDFAVFEGGGPYSTPLKKVK